MSSDLKRKTAKGLAWGAIASILQTLIAFIFGILVARILSPSDYGMIGMLSIFSSLAVVLQESGFVFVLANRANISNDEYSTVFWFNISISSILYLLLYFSAPLISSFYGIEELTSLARFVFLGFIISSFGVVQHAYLYRTMKVRERSVARITGLIIACIIGLLMAIYGFKYWGIAVQSVTSTLISTVVIWAYSSFRPRLRFDANFFRSVYKDGLNFAASNLLGVLSNNIYSVILGKFFTVKDVGYYGQAEKFNNYGYSTVLSMVRNVTQPMLVEARTQGGVILPAFRKLVRFTAFVTMPSMFLLSVVSSEFIELLLTSKWSFSASILRVLCIGGSFTAIGTLFTYLLISQSKSSVYLWLGVLISLLKIIFLFLSSFGGVVLLAYICVVMEFSSCLLYYFFSKNTIGYKVKFIMSDLLPIIIVSIISALAAGLIALLFNGIFVKIIVKISCMFILLILLLEVVKYDIYMEVKQLIRNKILEVWKGIC